MQPTSNLILLASEGAKYLRLRRDGLYEVKPDKRGATHRLHSTRPNPRILSPSVTPKGVIRCVYANPDNFVDFPDNPDGRVLAANWLDQRKELAASAMPLSAVAVPRGVSYKNFVQRRTEAAKNGSLYDKKKPKQIMANKTAKPGKAGTKDTKNGITRPKEGTITRKVWDAADKYNGDRQAVFAACTKARINEATIATQFGKWRAYNGLVGRSTKAKGKPARKAPPPPPKAKAKPAKPAKAKSAPPPPPVAAAAE